MSLLFFYCQSLKKSVKKFTMAVSVGVNGTVNGRSASSPTANSTFNDVNSSSFPAKGNKEKSKTRCNRSQKSRQNVGHLHQKSIQNTKEKVKICSSTQDSVQFTAKTQHTDLCHIPGTHLPVCKNVCALLLIRITTANRTATPRA